MSDSHWRRTAAPIIERVLRQTRGLSEKEIRQALCKAYPFGQRSYHPYKIWLDEIATQRGQKPANRRRVVSPVVDVPGQETFF